jgi:hypothetical protein
VVTTNDDAFAGWAIVEVVGRKQYAGLVREQLVAGHPLLRVDVPEVVSGTETIPAFTKFVGPGSIYMLTPTDEATARAVACSLRERPVHVWQMPMTPRTALQRATDDDARLWDEPRGDDDDNPDSDEDIPDDLDDGVCGHCEEAMTTSPLPDAPTRECPRCFRMVHPACEMLDCPKGT